MTSSQPEAVGREQLGQVRVGTSGYSFEDWRETFYPEKIEKGKIVDCYLVSKCFAYLVKFQIHPITSSIH